MRDVGLERKELEDILRSKLSEDCDFNAGFILGSMCTEPLEIAREIYAKYLHINIGDKGIAPCSAKFEDQLITDLSHLFHGENIVGNFTSGGTESNIIAVRIARKLKKVNNPELIVSESAHLSFEKLADLIGVKIVKAALKPDFSLDLEDVEKKINKNTCGIVGIAGTTGLGLIDPIEELGELALKHDLYLHIDAAFGGFILPFMQDLRPSLPKWDFAVERVNSITADPHKMGLGIIPAGTFLIKKDQSLKDLTFEIPYLAGGGFNHFNLTGTRPGAAVIAFWATFNYLGKKGYQQIINQCLENTQYFVKKIADIKGIKIVVDPPLNVVGITLEDNSNISHLNAELKKKKWRLGEFKRFNFLRVVCMPHVKKEHLDMFCNDLESIVKQKLYTIH